MRGKLDNLESGQKLTNERLAAIEHHMAGFHRTGVTHGDELDNLRARVDRIVKRLGLVDEPPPS